MTVVDVGSAGGLHKRWKPFESVLSTVLFEPREGGSASGSLGRGQTRTYPVALGDRAGEVNLYITQLANMSSFLEPDADVFRRYRKKGADAHVVATEKVPVERLDTLAEADGIHPDILKVDTQGSELLVLKGAEQSLASVLVAEIEAWMNERGFELIELHKLKRYRAANSLGVRQPVLGGAQRSGRVAYGDAIFMRSPDAILAAAKTDGGASVLKAMVALLAYGKADHAAALLDAGKDLMASERHEAVRKALGGMKRILPPLSSLLPRG